MSNKKHEFKHEPNTDRLDDWNNDSLARIMRHELADEPFLFNVLVELIENEVKQAREQYETDAESKLNRVKAEFIRDGHSIESLDDAQSHVEDAKDEYDTRLDIQGSHESVYVSLYDGRRMSLVVVGEDAVVCKSQIVLGRLGDLVDDLSWLSVGDVQGVWGDAR